MRCFLAIGSLMAASASCGEGEGAGATDRPMAGGAGAAASAGSQTAGSATVAGGGSGGNAGSGSVAAGSAGMASGGTTAGGASAGAPNAEAGAGGDGSDAPVPSLGCQAIEAPVDGPHDLQVMNLMRSYVLRKPAGYSATVKRAWPLVLALHPNGSTSAYWDGTTGPRALRPLLANKAILVSAQARNNDWRGDVPLDLSYFEALLRELKSGLCIDTSRIFAMGFSGGGSFSGVLGCYRADIRAFAAGGAVIYFKPAECTGKPASWITIGDDEAVQGRLDYRDFFRSDAGCAATSKPVNPSPCVAFDCPSPERPVTFCSHPGGHLWPDFGSQAALDFFWQF